MELSGSFAHTAYTVLCSQNITSARGFGGPRLFFNLALPQEDNTSFHLIGDEAERLFSVSYSFSFFLFWSGTREERKRRVAGGSQSYRVKHTDEWQHKENRPTGREKTQRAPLFDFCHSLHHHLYEIPLSQREVTAQSVFTWTIMIKAALWPYLCSNIIHTNQASRTSPASTDINLPTAYVELWHISVKNSLIAI